MIDEVITSYVEGSHPRVTPRSGTSSNLWTALKTLYPISLTIDEAIEQAGGRTRPTSPASSSIEEIKADAQAAYDQREEDLGAEVLRELERRVLLSVLDRKWREHLYEMDYLREGIGLRAMAQRDPLVEYQREGFDMFSAMMDGIKEESVGFLFNLEVEVDEDGSVTAGPAPAPSATPADRERPRRPGRRRGVRRRTPARRLAAQGGAGRARVEQCRGERQERGQRQCRQGHRGQVRRRCPGEGSRPQGAGRADLQRARARLRDARGVDRRREHGQGDRQLGHGQAPAVAQQPQPWRRPGQQAQQQRQPQAQALGRHPPAPGSPRMSGAGGWSVCPALSRAAAACRSSGRGAPRGAGRSPGRGDRPAGWR